MSRFANKLAGILALQGDYERHEHQLKLLDVKSRLVRLASDLEGLDCLIIPGGESTTMDILLDRFELRKPLTKFAQAKPVFGTCAGMILLVKKVENNVSGVEPLGLLDVDVVKNGYGRQVFSFAETISADLGITPVELSTTFIRAPKITRVGSVVSVLATYRDDPVLVRQGNLLASAFHTELDDDTTLLEYFLTEVS